MLDRPEPRSNIHLQAAGYCALLSDYDCLCNDVMQSLAANSPKWKEVANAKYEMREEFREVTTGCPSKRQALKVFIQDLKTERDLSRRRHPSTTERDEAWISVARAWTMPKNAPHMR